MARPDFIQYFVCRICDPDRKTIRDTAQQITSDKIICANVLSHEDKGHGRVEMVLERAMDRRVWRTDGWSRAYHYHDQCRAMQRGQQSAKEPQEVFETGRPEALRSGRSACRACCPADWDQPLRELDGS